MLRMYKIVFVGLLCFGCIFFGSDNSFGLDTGNDVNQAENTNDKPWLKLLPPIEFKKEIPVYTYQFKGPRGAHLFVIQYEEQANDPIRMIENNQKRTLPLFSIAPGVP